MTNTLDGLVARIAGSGVDLDVDGLLLGDGGRRLLLLCGRSVDDRHGSRMGDASEDVLSVVERLAAFEAVSAEVVVGAAGALVTNADDGLAVDGDEGTQ